MKKNIILMLSIFFLNLSLAYGQEFKQNETPIIETVTVTGLGADEQKAIQNASMKAVKQIVGMYVVTDEEMKNNELIKDRVLSQSNGYIKSFKTLNTNKDEDGVTVIQAQVEVEMGKLTNNLKELNIAFKNVDSAPLYAVALDRSSSASDFRRVANAVIFEPVLTNKKIYDLEIKSFKLVDFQKINSRDIHWSNKEEMNLALQGQLQPVEIAFHISLNNAYLTSVSQFLEKTSKKSYGAPNCPDENHICFFKPNKSIDRRRLGIVKTYELTPANFNIYSSLCKEVRDIRQYITFALLDINNSEFKKFSYEARPFQHKGYDLSNGDDVSVSFIRYYDQETDKFKSSRLFENINGFVCHLNRPEINFMKNIYDFKVVILLNKEDLAMLKSVKLEVNWENKKIKARW